MISFRRVLFSISSRLDMLQQKIINSIINRLKAVNHKQIKMFFYVPNPLNKYRIKTFSTKEPETLAWIDSFKKNSVFWDVGANIGLYSIYAAKASSCKVFAFEPSVFNSELLAKNININNLSLQIAIFPIALSNKSGINLFQMNNPLWGGALSTFGENYDQHGDDFQATFDYSIPGITADKIIKLMSIPKPNYIKIDVDGIEHLILEGGSNILKTVDSVIIEINDNFDKQANISEKYLLQSGLFLRDKFYLGSGNQYNQLWVREG